MSYRMIAADTINCGGGVRVRVELKDNTKRGGFHPGIGLKVTVGGGKEERVYGKGASATAVSWWPDECKTQFNNFDEGMIDVYVTHALNKLVERMRSRIESQRETNMREARREDAFQDGIKEANIEAAVRKHAKKLEELQ